MGGGVGSPESSGSAGNIRLVERGEQPEEWEWGELARLIFLQRQVAPEYVRALADYIADRVLEDPRLQRRYATKEGVPRFTDKYEFILSDREAYAQAMAVFVDLLRQRGVRFVALPVGKTEYKLHYAQSCALIEGADALLLRAMGELFGPSPRGRLSLAKSLLLQNCEVLGWGDVNRLRYVPMADGRALDPDSLRLLEEVPGYYTARAGVALSQGDLDMLRSWLGKFTWEEGEELLLSMAPNYAKAYKNVFYNEKLRAQAREMLGSILFDGVLRKAFVVKGPPEIGKSVIADTLRAALGGLCSSVSWETLFGPEGEKRLGVLAGKYANITCETPRQALVKVDLFKAITGDEELWGELKYVNPFPFRNRVKLIVFCNELPVFKRADEAALERLYVIDCEGASPPSEPDPQLREKIKRGELRYVFLHLVWCYLELRERNFVFKHAPSAEEVGKMVVEAYMGLEDYIMARCETGPEFREEGERLYRAYVEWCAEAGVRPAGRTTFYAMLEAAGFRKYLREGKTWFKGIRVRREEAPSHLLDL